MPCFTKVTVEVKEEKAAKEAAAKLEKQHGWKMTIQKLPNGTYQVTPAQSYPGFEKAFKNEYAAAVATAKAKAAGYTVIRKDVGNQVELTLRQYT